MAAGVATAGLSVASGAAGAATERHGIRFDRVVNAVDDLGLDPNGQEPIDDGLASVAREGDTLVQFPPGEYLVDDKVDVGDDFGIESTTGDREDVVFTPVRGKLTRLFGTDGDPSGFYVGQVTLDRRDEYRSSLELVRGGFTDAVQVHDVLVEGWAPESGNKILTFNVYDPDGSALVDGVTDRGPAQFGAYPDGTSITIFNGRATEGDITYRNLEIHNASESGIYAGKAKGTIRVEDSYFENCAHSAVRVTGNDSVVRNTTVVMDASDLHPDAEVTDPEGVDFNRGIWAQSADVEKGGPLVEGCDIVVEDSGGGVGAIVNNSDTGGFEIRNTRVECNDSTGYFDPIRIVGESTSDAGTPYEALIDGVSITGEASAKPAIRVDDRDGTVVRNCCIQMPNTDGIAFEGTSDGRIENTSISVGGEATIFDDADVETQGVTSGDSCPLPDPGSWDDGDGGGGGGDDGDDGDEGGGGDDGDETLPHTLAVSKEAEDLPDGDVTYEFTVSEALSATEDVEVGGNDTVSGTTASGGMGPKAGVDTYRFDGVVEQFSLDGAARVFLDGDRVAPEDVVGRPADPEEITDGRVTGDLAAGESAAYTYTVDGTPSSVEVALAADADLDLYVTHDGRVPRRDDHDQASRSGDGTETVTVDDVTDGQVLGIAVWGVEAGSFTLTVDAADADPGAEPVLHLPFNGDGPEATDVAGGNDAEAVAGAPGRVDGRGGTAARFDGADAYAVADDSTYDLSTGTVSVHVRLDAGGSNGFLSKDAGGRNDPGHLSLGTRDGDLWCRLQSGDEEWRLSGPTVSTGEWHHVVLSFGDEARLYLDGTEVDSADTTQGIDGNPNPFAVGANNWASSDGQNDDLRWLLDGAIDDLRVYGQQLLPEDVPVPEDGDGGGGDDNQAPTAAVEADATTVSVGEAVTLSATGSSDPDGSIRSYEWALGDGTRVTGESVTHAYDDAGAYTATVTVTDDAGATATASVTVTVEQATSLPNTVVFDGNGSGTTAYELTVTGALQRDEDASSTESLLGDFDEVNGSTATGTVVSGKDVYRFDGDLTSLRANGDARVTLDDDE